MAQGIWYSSEKDLWEREYTIRLIEPIFFFWSLFLKIFIQYFLARALNWAILQLCRSFLVWNRVPLNSQLVSVGLTLVIFLLQPPLVPGMWALYRDNVKTYLLHKWITYFKMVSRSKVIGHTWEQDGNNGPGHCFRIQENSEEEGVIIWERGNDIWNILFLSFCCLMQKKRLWKLQ